MSEAQINVSRISTEVIRVPVVGTAPLIVHRFAEKAKRQMLDAAQQRKTPKQPKDPDAEYTAAFYRMDNGDYGVPTLGLKAATIRGATYFGKNVAMTTLRQCLFFMGETTKLGDLLTPFDSHSTPVMREDVVRVNMGGTDLRYRPQFDDWSLTLCIRYVTTMLTRDSVLSLIEAGGMGVGIGEWRPQKGGQFGTYRIDDTRDVEVMDP
jgi:hypothetical protein